MNWEKRLKTPCSTGLRAIREHLTWEEKGELSQGDYSLKWLMYPMLRNVKILGVARGSNCQNKEEMNVTEVKQTKEL